MLARLYRQANFFVASEVLGLTAAADTAAKTTVAATTLSDVAKLGVVTLLRFHGAANLIVATAATSLMGSKAPRKMRRVVESTLFAYGLALVAVAFRAQRGGLWTAGGKYLAHCYGGFCVLFFAYCLLTE